MIYFLTDGLFRVAGTERVIVQLFENLSQYFEIKIIAPGSTIIGFNTTKEIKVKSLGVGDLPKNFISKVFHRILILLSLRNIVIKNSIIFSFAYDLNIINIVLTRLLGGHSIVCEHIEYSYHGFFRRLLRKYIYSCENITVVCLTEIDRAKYSKIGISAQVIPNFVKLKNHSYSPNKKIILAVGRLTRQKNFAFLIDSFFISRLYNRRWKMLIIGEGIEYAMLQNKINFYELGGSIEICKFTKDIDSYYRQASIFCMTSLYEAFPMVLLEAMSYGVPVLCVDCPTGPSEIIGSDDTSQLVAPGSPDLYADALRNLCMDSPNLAQLSNKNNLRVMKFSVDRVVGYWLDLLNKTIK